MKPEDSTGRLARRSFPAIAAIAIAIVALAAGCGGAPPRAPVSERTPADARKPPAVAAPAAKEPDWRPRTYTVKKGDTLYSIALEHGLDHKELAAWNSIDTPGRIRVGQQLLLAPPKEESVVVTPARSAGGVEVRPLGATEAAKPEPAKTEALKPEPARAETPKGDGLVREPKALKLPYS
ncbi:MAG TPA: LysM peptidoglycan-binding domain-containing protein, partial [Burkholderiales bacterium]|nr:LysM peptidoglycan-binding domain-containing protein [Burkholderiales bacterium]